VVDGSDGSVCRNSTGNRQLCVGGVLGGGGDGGNMPCLVGDLLSGLKRCESVVDIPAERIARVSRVVAGSR